MSNLNSLVDLVLAVLETCEETLNVRKCKLHDGFSINPDLIVFEMIFVERDDGSDSDCYSYFILCYYFPCAFALSFERNRCLTF